jgi:5'/3'-nucleotidase SurE
MRTTRSLVLSAVFCLLLAPPAVATGGGHGGGPLDLNILVTNDDGFDSPGLAAVRQALIDAGHTVTVVAPASQQSGKGGSINTSVLNFDVGDGTRVLTNTGNDTWAFDGSPSDCVGVALDVVMAGNPPDLIVSGLNEGQNLGKPGSNASGTVGAALRGTFNGIPAIAGSVEILFGESGDGFPSTVAAYAPAADFIARLVDRLTAANGARILPPGVRLVNVNFPVPYADVQGVKTTRLADGGNFDLPLFDPSQGFPALGVPPLPFPSCADADAPGESCFVSIGLGFPTGPDPVANSDTNAFTNRYISVTPLNADMTAGFFGVVKTAIQVNGMAP